MGPFHISFCHSLAQDEIDVLLFPIQSQSILMQRRHSFSEAADHVELDDTPRKERKKKRMDAFYYLCLFPPVLTA